MVSENEFLLHALLMGGFITFVYDLLRILRRAIPHRPIVVSLEDLGFWIYCSMEVFLLMYHESNGTLRWFAVLGAFVGMLLYRKLFSGLLVKYCSMALGKLFKIIGKLLGILLRPLRFVGKKVGQCTGKTCGSIRQFGNKIKRAVKFRLTIFMKMLRINLKA